MDITVMPGKLHGALQIIPSKSQAHRLLICAAFADRETTIICPQTNQDIEATADCLCALGAVIRRTAEGYHVTPVSIVPQTAQLNCRESGSTLRFMLPIVGALGVDAVFHMSGRLPQRPLSPLWEEMERMGCRLTRGENQTLRCCGRLRSGEYSIAGNVSSQFITGLLFAMALLPGNCSLSVLGEIESKPYIQLTQAALKAFGVDTQNLCVNGCYPFRSPGILTVEGDWSNGAFFLAANALGSSVTLTGLDPESCQGDRAVSRILPQLQSGYTTVDAADIPDLVPILTVAAGAFHGAEFVNIRRLRIKESDRVEAVAQMLGALGVQTCVSENAMRIIPGQYNSCVIDAHGDHRIAMSAAIAATVATGPVYIHGAQCVAKSFPSFWEDYRELGGNYEQHIR